MNKKDKYLKKALDFLELEFDFNDCDEINNEHDLELKIKEAQQLVSSLENHIIEINDSIKLGNELIKQLEIVKHQIKVERYKDLNKKDVDIF